MLLRIKSTRSFRDWFSSLHDVWLAKYGNSKILIIASKLIADLKRHWKNTLFECLNHKALFVWPTTVHIIWATIYGPYESYDMTHMIWVNEFDFAMGQWSNFNLVADYSQNHVISIIWYCDKKFTKWKNFKTMKNFWMKPQNCVTNKILGGSANDHGLQHMDLHSPLQPATI